MYIYTYMNKIAGPGSSVVMGVHLLISHGFKY